MKCFIFYAFDIHDMFFNVCITSEKELVLEIERLKHKSGPAAKKSKLPSKLDMFIRGVEEERDYYRQQTDMLQRIVKGDMKPAVIKGKVSSRPTSPSCHKTSAAAADKKVDYHHDTICLDDFFFMSANLDFDT